MLINFRGSNQLLGSGCASGAQSRAHLFEAVECPAFALFASVFSHVLGKKKTMIVFVFEIRLPRELCKKMHCMQTPSVWVLESVSVGS